MKKLLTVLFFILPFALAAQNVDFKKQNFPNDPEGFNKAFTSLKKGQDMFASGPRFFERSLKYLLEAQEFNPNNSELNFTIGYVYNALNLKGEAAEYFKRAASLNPKFQKEGQILTAENYHLDMQWDKASTEYREYIKLLEAELPTAKPERKAEIDLDIKTTTRKIQMCANGKVLLKDTVPIIIINLGKGVNSKYPDYSAIVTADEKNIYYTSRRPNTTGGGIPVGDVFYFEDIYHSQKGEDGRWSSAKQVKGLINSKDHEGTVAITADGKRMIIYRYRNEGDLFESKQGDDGSWSLPKSLAGVNSKYRESHASYSPDGKTLYFTSNNPEIGAKGLDIFKVNYDSETEKWGSPERLTENVNTDFDEDGVFIDNVGQYLYFSSKGHNSMGGYDIFRSEIVNGVPGPAVNLGYPINTPADDVFFVVMPGGVRAYFDSNRRGGFGEKDIYTMLFLKDLKLMISGTVYDADTKEIITEPAISIAKNKTNIDLEYPSKGSYKGTVMATESYKAEVSAEGYESFTEFFTAEMEHPDSFTIKKDFYLKPLKFLVLKGKVYDENTEQVIPADIVFETVMGDSKITAKSGDNGYESKLDRMGVYKVRVTSNGYQSYEDIISLNEAGVKGNTLEKDFYLLKTGDKAIVREITLEGSIIEKINDERKSGKIIIKDQNNKVLSTLSTSPTQKYSTKIKTNTVYNFTVESEGYADINERVVIKVPAKTEKVEKNFYVEKSEENVLAIRSIYFDFDKFNIRNESLTDLNNIVKIMGQYPDAKVEISGHTDSRGSYEYNLTLSLNRAKQAYNWLIANGVSKNRITYSNYSFSKPAAPNKNEDGSDNPEGRQKNRRVDFRVFNNVIDLDSGE
ncbi:MAG: OmpA family protein [Flavobacteriales bacterium]|nr:OmpA family protein [Flavobacteriales bacterium]